jgi:hydrogenase maturation protein HypF
LTIQEPPIKSLRIKITGIVQGVGFRPFVYGLAKALNLTGWVQNGSEGVLIEVEGDDSLLAEFLCLLEQDAPPLAIISSVVSVEIPPLHSSCFTIIESSAGSGNTLISPDTDVCPDCLLELFDPSGRRYRYPFINCTNCGPRYSIITAIPYDRPNTTMSGFPLCPDCEKEYRDPSDRRFHAQPIACPHCGPRLQLFGAAGEPLSSDPLDTAVKMLHEGAIVAVKGIGGYHLAVDPFNETAVRELRRRKKRDEKPFALVTGSIEKARELAYISRTEELLLAGRERPIMLLRKQPGNRIAPEVAPANDYFGIMLPSSPLHYLLLRDNFDALVMTSANLSDDPVIYRDADALKQLSGVADFFLAHDREIIAPSDDSVIRVFRTHPLMMRRSRGYVPRPVMIPGVNNSVLALGAELKSAVCLATGDQAFLSRHLGDLKSAATLASFPESIAALEEITGIFPEIVAHDLHPDYHSTVFAATLPKKKIAVQHHHAHLASCMAENRLEGEVIGIILDGAGYGADGTIWGGEFLTGGYSSFSRAGHLRHMAMPGGDPAAREPYRMAISLLFQLYGDKLFEFPLQAIREIPAGERKIFLQMLDKGINSPMTSSCGRLFDAVAALLGIRSRMSYEGQAAIELEGAAEDGVPGTPYPFSIDTADGLTTLDWRPALKALLAGMSSGCKVADIAATFHHSLALASVAVCQEIRSSSGLGRVVLSGGVFQNRLLSEEMVTLLEKEGFEVYTHRLVPPNDGGVALGQAMIAGRSLKCV